LALLVDKFTFSKKSAEYHSAPRTAIIIGLLGTIVAFAPIVVTNRYVSFDRFSHYTLPASIAATVFLFGLWTMLSGGVPRRVMVAALVMSAALTHFNLSARVADEARNIAQFWQQMAWRAPDIRTGTTLVVDYAGIYYAESADLVWGPANIIYYPEPSAEMPIRIPIAAAQMEADLRKDAFAGGSATQNYIIINVLRYDYDNLLVISQPSPSSCVHVMDGRWPAFSAYEDTVIVSVAEKSKTENILAASGSPALPENLFGAEPEHGWCYFYQKADLARQLGDWAAVTRLETESAQSGFEASDPIEWIPFVQARVLRGDADGLTRLAQILKSNAAYKADRDYYKTQFCNSIRALGTAGFKAPAETLSAAESLFCQ
jgi:hypothetical protein